MSTKYNTDDKIVLRRACQNFYQCGHVCAVFDGKGRCQNTSLLKYILAQPLFSSFFFPLLLELNDDIAAASSTCCHDSVMVPVILSLLVLSVVGKQYMYITNDMADGRDFDDAGRDQ